MVIMSRSRCDIVIVVLVIVIMELLLRISVLNRFRQREKVYIYPGYMAIIVVVFLSVCVVVYELGREFQRPQTR